MTSMDNLTKEKRDLIRVLSCKFGIKRHKARVKVPTIVDSIMHTTRSDRTTLSYFTACKRFNKKANVRDVLSEPSPYIVPKLESSKEEDVQPKESRPSKNGYQQPTFRGKQRGDLLESIFVQDDFSHIPQSKCDLDPEYFTVINGRRIMHKFSRRSYIETMRDTLRAKLTEGFIQDEIQHRKERDLLNKWHLNKIAEDQENISASYDMFLSENHEMTTRLVKLSLRASQSRQNKEKELNEMYRCFNVVKCSMLNELQVWETEKLCLRVLYHISPTQWQEDYEAKRKEYTPQMSNEVEELKRRHGEIITLDENDQDIDGLAYQLEEDLNNIGPPIMFFKETWQVELVFRKIELQNLRALAHIAAIKNLRDMVKSTANMVTVYYSSELKTIEDLMEDTENGLVYHKERSRYIELITRDNLKASFKETYSGEKTLKAMALLQTLFENIMGANENNLDCVGMMRAIEKTFEDIWYLLRTLSTEELRVETERATAQKNASLKAAEKARLRRHQLEVALKSMKKMYQAPIMWGRLGKRPTERSRPPPERRFRDSTATAPTREHIEEEKRRRANWERVKLFVDYSDDEDIGRYECMFNLDDEIKTVDEDWGSYASKFLSTKRPCHVKATLPMIVPSINDDISSLQSDWIEWWKKNDIKSMPSEDSLFIEPK